MENTKQKTIKQAVSLSGVGLHTGLRVNMTFKPAKEYHGIKFQRIDMENKPLIEALVENVVETARGTTIGKEDAKVGTIEHAMAACAGLEIDNLLIEIDAPEVPIMDGSSQHFIKALLDAGIKEQHAEKEYFEITQNIHYSDPEAKIEMIAMPLDSFRITCMIDFNNPVIGSQHASISHISEFAREIAGSRTFCPLTELEGLYDKGLIKGGDINNAIVIADKEIPAKELEKLAALFHKSKDEFRIGSDGILNNVSLRYQNEPARHKLLDMIGDLSLIGVPIKAQRMAARPGHKANIEFAKKIKKYIKTQITSSKSKAPQYNIYKKPVFTAKEIERILPHRYPFLLVDKIIDITENRIIGIKNVTFNENYFMGHFPGDPVMPGVLQIEALAQTGGVLILNNKPDPENYSTLFMKIDKAKFKDKVVPGDTLILDCEMIAPVRRGISIMTGKIYVADKLVMEAELMAQIIKNK
jgi:UDP-3-O-[3-hydroxymyristoyl] N-acetylglucosamine deacetylase / 3-hydroxyacyl-[acyl-carrier-protein] dehydratase